MCKFGTVAGVALAATTSQAAADGQLSMAYRFELVGSSGSGRPSAAACFASLSTSAFGQRCQPQVPLFHLARAAVAEQLRVIKIKGDGRCMFRALAVGMARNQGRFLGGQAEEQEADQLRLAVAEALCRTKERRNQFPEAVLALEAEDRLPNYCRRIVQPTFWGGEPELLVLSQMLKVPIFVYLHTKKGFSVIQKYGERYAKPSGGKKKGRRPVRILFVNGNHYDLLV